MFLIDLNRMYVKIVNGSHVWTHDLSDIQFMAPDSELVHVRRGRQMAVMPFLAVHEWLWPFGPFYHMTTHTQQNTSNKFGVGVSR